MDWARLCLFAVMWFSLCACSSKLAGMNDEDLQDKMNACNRTTEQSPGFAISCDNYRRECAERREQGRYVC